MDKCYVSTYMRYLRVGRFIETESRAEVNGMGVGSGAEGIGS